MAPPQTKVPVSELEDRVQYTTKNFKSKRRKLPKDFSLKRDCELLELVQYTSGPTLSQKQEMLRKNPKAHTRMESFPFVRLFRKCGQGDDTFMVETTAWEGEHAWNGKRGLEEDKGTSNVHGIASSRDAFAQYSGYFWAQK